MYDWVVYICPVPDGPRPIPLSAQLPANDAIMKTNHARS